MAVQPTRLQIMSDFRQDDHGNWWLNIMARDNTFTRVSVKEEYIDVWMARYRRFLGLTPMPSPDDDSPLLAMRRGRAGLSARHIRLLVQGLFDNALVRMRAGVFHENDVRALRSASLYWLRDTWQSLMRKCGLIRISSRTCAIAVLSAH